jgi:hypothetical protein
MLRNMVGPPARGEDFFDREEIIELIWDRLEVNNILLAAPRRFGKTSVMYRLIDYPKEGWKPVHVDAESISHPVKFIIAVLDSLMADSGIRNYLVASWKKTKGWMRNLIEEIDLKAPFDVDVKVRLRKAVEPDWRERGKELFKTLKSYDAGKKLLLIIDELPVMLYLFQDNDTPLSQIKEFLYWFRELRINPDICSTNCRFLVGGSIGIDTYLSRINALPAINDFEKVAIGELDGKNALRLVEQLLESRNIKLSRASKREILNMIGSPIPYFIQVFVNEIANELTQRPDITGPKRLQEIYQDRVLGASQRSYFQYYYDRLRYYDKIEENAAKELLKQLALAYPTGIEKSTLFSTYKKASGKSGNKEDFSRLLADLENDFYIKFSEGGSYVFASKILCDWWRRYYAF